MVRLGYLAPNIEMVRLGYLAPNPHFIYIYIYIKRIWQQISKPNHFYDKYAQVNAPLTTILKVWIITFTMFGMNSFQVSLCVSSIFWFILREYILISILLNISSYVMFYIAVLWMVAEIEYFVHEF